MFIKEKQKLIIITIINSVKDYILLINSLMKTNTFISLEVNIIAYQNNSLITTVK